MSTNVTFDGTVYAVPASGERNWGAQVTGLLVALGNKAAINEEMKQAIRVALTSPVTVADTTDFAVVTDLTTPGAVTVNLPAGTAGRIFAIVDGKGDAATNNVTINRAGSDTIAGSTSLTLNTNRQAVLLQYSSTGTDWKILYNSIPSPTTIANTTINNTNTINVKDTLFRVEDDGDATKKLAFQLSGVTTGNTRTVTIPDADSHTITAGTQTIAGAKTFSSALTTSDRLLVASGASAAAPDMTFTGDDDTGIYRITNNTLGFATSGTEAGRINGSGVWTLAGGLATTTIANTCTINAKDTLFTLQDDGDAAKQARFQCSGITTGNTRVLTVPDFDGTIATIAGTEILTNKDYDGGTASNTSRLTIPKASKSTLDGLTRKEATLVYASDLDKLYSDNGSSLVEIGAGAGGELNVIDNPSDASAGWAASAGTVTVATSTTASDLPLAGIIESAIKITRASGTDHVRYRWTQPAGLKNKKLKVEWHQRPLSGYASGDFKVEVYKNSASDYTGSYTEFPLSTDASGTSAIPNATGKFTTTFDADDGDYYELRIVSVSGTTALNIANVIVGPGIQPQGSVVTEWVSYTPTLTNVTDGTSPIKNFRWRRIGDSMHISGEMTLGTGGDLTGTLAISLPTGYTTDTTKIPSASGSVALGGYAFAYDASTNDIFTGRVLINNSSTSIRIGNWESTNATEWAAAAPFDWTTSDIFGFNAYVPIAEWSGSGTVNVAQNDVEYVSNSSTTDADDTTSFAYGRSGGQFPNVTAARVKRVRFSTPISASEKIELEVSNDSGVTWVDTHSSQIVEDWSNQNAVDYGMRLQPVSATDVDVYFSRYRRATGATFGAAGEDWSGIDADPQYKWRAKKVSGGQAVGFGLADTAGNAGLVNPYSSSGAGVVYSGRYTPTDGGFANVNVAAFTQTSNIYMRVGKIVTVYGSVQIDPTAAAGANTALGVSLPIASDLSSSDAWGTVTCTDATSDNQQGVIFANAASNVAVIQFYAIDTANREFYYTFSYEIK